MGAEIPEVRYATTRDGLRIAYGIAGDGPPLVYVRSLNSHVQRDWGDTWRGAYYKALANAFTVINFDARGNGLSDEIDSIDLESLIEDLRSVVDDLDLDRFALYGQGFGSPIAMAYAARHPQRIDGLIMYCAYANGGDLYIPDFFMDAFRENPPAATAIMGHATYPDAYKLPANLLRPSSVAATPKTAILYFELVRTLDVSDIVP